REPVELQSETLLCCELPTGFQPRQFANDAAGATYVTGHTFKPGDNEEDIPAYDILTIKFDRDGQGIWTNRYDGAAQEDDSSALALDGWGNLYVVGTTTLSSTGPSGMVLLKYAQDGKPLWTNCHYGRFYGLNNARALVVDPAGDVTIAGLVPAGLFTGSYETDLVKFDSDG